MTVYRKLLPQPWWKRLWLWITNWDAEYRLKQSLGGMWAVDWATIDSYNGGWCWERIGFFNSRGEAERFIKIHRKKNHAIRKREMERETFIRTEYM